MRYILLSAALIASAALAQTTPAQPTPTQPSPAPLQLAQTPTVQVATLSLSAANRIAMLTVNNCAQLGYTVTATVVDRMGVTLAVARAENAGPHTVDASLRKAYTSASARNLTSELAKNLATTPSLADIPGFLVLGGGAPIRVGGAVVGAVGVGGAPSGLTDEQCATDAIKTVLAQ